MWKFCDVCVYTTSTVLFWSLCIFLFSLSHTLLKFFQEHTKFVIFFLHRGLQYRRCHVQFFCSGHMRLLKIWIHPMDDTGFIFLHKFFPLDSSFLVTHATFVFLTHFVTHYTHCLQIVTEIPLPFTVEHWLYIKYGMQCDPVSPLLWLWQWHDVYHFTQQCWYSHVCVSAATRFLITCNDHQMHHISSNILCTPVFEWHVCKMELSYINKLGIKDNFVQHLNNIWNKYM